MESTEDPVLSVEMQFFIKKLAFSAILREKIENNEPGKILDIYQNYVDYKVDH